MATTAKRTHIDPSLFQKTTVARVASELIRRYKAVLIGHEEVGKTSVCRCWESDPLFFKKLPQVMSTAGIERRTYSLKFKGEGAGGARDDVLDLEIQDFAGQEVYHSHSRFLTPRTVYLFVWKMTGGEEEDLDMSSFEEERMMMWLEDVCSKAPGSACVLIGTHYDELRDKSAEAVARSLRVVKEKFTEYAQSLKAPEGLGVEVAGSYAVSCKNRVAHGGELKDAKGAKMSELLRAIGKVAWQRCLSDSQFPQGAIPGRHLQLLKELQRLQDERQQLLIPLQEYAETAARFGIESLEELAACTMLFHCWSALYLFRTARDFTPAQLEANGLYGIFIHPLWLARMVPALFAMAHVVYTEPTMRRYIGGLEFSEAEALRADACGLRRGELTTALADVIFAAPLRELRRGAADAGDVRLCLNLLAAMDLVYEEVVDGASRTFVPSLFPLPCPIAVQDLIPYLFQRGRKRVYRFNIFPRDLYNRLACRLQPLAVTLRATVGGVVEPEGKSWGTDVQYLPDGERTRFELRNHWKDAMWVGCHAARALVYREKDEESGESLLHAMASPTLLSRRVLARPAAEVRGDPRTGDELLQVVDALVKDLAQEYNGLTFSAEDEAGVGGDGVAVEDELWDELRAALLGGLGGGERGGRRAAGLLQRLRCYVPDGAALPPAEEPVDGPQAARWLDRLIRELMIADSAQEQCDATAERAAWEERERKASERTLEQAQGPVGRASPVKTAGGAVRTAGGKARVVQKRAG